MIPIQKFNLEFILHANNATVKTVKSSLSEFAESVEVEDNHGGKSEDFKINLVTEDPTMIFDVCSQFGRIRSIKISEA